MMDIMEVLIALIHLLFAMVLVNNTAQEDAWEEVHVSTINACATPDSLVWIAL